MAEHYDFGKKAENEAVTYLKQNGYEILERNYYFQKAEIDIIAKIDTTLVIVEVKARSSAFFQEPEEAVNKKKRGLLIAAADAYVTRHNLDENVRFDIISILKEKSGELKINHIQNAFNIIE